MDASALSRCRTPRFNVGGSLSTTQHQLDPRNPATPEVSPHHLPQAPVLQVRALEVGIEHDEGTIRSKPRAELDVLDRGHGVALGVEAAGVEEGVASNRTESGPKRRHGSCSLLVNEVVEEIAKCGNNARSRG